MATLGFNAWNNQKNMIRRFVPSVLFKVMEIVNLTGVVGLIEMIKNPLSSRSFQRNFQ